MAGAHFSPITRRISGSAISAAPTPAGSATAVTTDCARWYAAVSRGVSSRMLANAGKKVWRSGPVVSRVGMEASVLPIE